MRITVLLALSHASDTSQALASGVMTGSLPGVVDPDRCQRPIGQRPLHAALNRLMMDPNSLPTAQNEGSRDRPAASVPAIPLAARLLDRERAVNLSIASSSSSIRLLSAILPLSRSSFRQRKTRNPPPNYKFLTAGS